MQKHETDLLDRRLTVRELEVEEESFETVPALENARPAFDPEGTRISLCGVAEVVRTRKRAPRRPDF